ncbi:MAG: hypothetical protein IT318_07795, partial [Anaerolineales bacterium]|nr:hypothetical protein [Anaerolineales bacterium]
MSNWAAEDEPLGLLAFGRLIIDALDAAHLDYALGGALAVAAWGEARSTQDIDLAIDLPVEQLRPFSAELEKRGVLIPPDLMRDQLLETRGDVALVGYHRQWSHKAELFLLRPGDDLRRSALSRRRLVDLGSPLGQVHVHAPEDLILYKLQFFSLSQQQKHTRDIGAILVAPSRQARHGLPEPLDRVPRVERPLAPHARTGWAAGRRRQRRLSVVRLAKCGRAALFSPSPLARVSAGSAASEAH